MLLCFALVSLLGLACLVVLRGGSVGGHPHPPRPTLARVGRRTCVTFFHTFVHCFSVLVFCRLLDAPGPHVGPHFRLVFD